MKQFINKLLIILLILLLIIKNKSTFVNKESGLNRLDAIIFINLDHRKDRLKEITGELERMGVKKDKIVRFSAVYDKVNGHLGCAKSHYGVMRIVKKSNFNRVLILEDDFKFNVDKETLDNKLDTFFNHFKDNWHAVHLSSSYVNENHKYNNNPNFKKLNLPVIRINSVVTASAYIVNNKGEFFDDLISDFKMSRDKIAHNMIEWNEKNPGKKRYEDGDALNQHWGSLQTRSKWFLFKPVLGEQRTDSGKGSSIMGFLNDKEQHNTINESRKEDFLNYSYLDDLEEDLNK